jgi:hypothetical protein
MNEGNNPPRTSISQAYNLEEIAAFWDTHSLADYWEETHEVDFTMRVGPKLVKTLGDKSVDNKSATQSNND